MGELAKRQTGGAMQTNEDRQKAVEPQVVAEVRRHQRSIDQMLPRGFDVKRFVAMTFDAFRQSPKLLDCPVESVLGGAMAAAKLGLSPNTPTQQCWLVATWNGRAQRNEAELWLGYRGAITLATRAPSVTRVWADVVREHDEFEHESGSSPLLIHKPLVVHRDRGGMRPVLIEGERVDPRGQLVAAYACARGPDGFVIHHVMPALDVLRIKDMVLGSKTKKSFSPWVQWEDRMWRKTPVKPLAKFIEVPESSAEGFRLDDLAEAGKTQQLGQQWKDIPTKSAHVQVPGAPDQPAIEEPEPRPNSPEDVGGYSDQGGWSGAAPSVEDILADDDGRSGEGSLPPPEEK